MNLKLTPKAQQIMAEKGNNASVSLQTKVCYT